MKAFCFKLLLIICIALHISFSIEAETDGGTWKIHPVFNSNRTRVIDTGDRVYCLTDCNLNYYDKASGAWEGMTVLNGLNEYHIKNIYYNAEKNYLVVAYNNYNIDILLTDGRTMNIPNLKNLVTTSARTINDVTFGKNAIYVASEVGYLVIEDANFTVTKAAFWNTPVKSLAEVGNRLVLCDGSNTYTTTLDTDVKMMSQLTSTDLGITGTMLPINDNAFFINQSSRLYLITIADNETFAKATASTGKVIDIQPTGNGYIAVGGSSLTATTKYYAYDTDGKKTADITLPAELKNTLFTSRESDGSLWRLGATGLQHVSLDATSSTVTTHADETCPNFVTARRIGALAYNKGNGRMYVTNGGAKSEYLINQYGVVALISSFGENGWRNELSNSSVKDPYEPVFDPDDPETFYVGTWYSGVYKIKDKDIAAQYYWENSPMVHALNNWFCLVQGLQFDNDGNLWAIQFTYHEKVNEIYVLPKEKLSKSTTELTESDWIIPDFQTDNSKRVVFTIDSKNNKILYDGIYNVHFLQNDKDFHIENSGTFKHFTAQDGQQMNLHGPFDFEEDKNGIVWMGQYYGFCGFNPSEAFNDGFKVIRPKDKDNPGTVTLNNQGITAISVDDYNRKWMGTLDDGFYLLNEDCTKVLKHFNTSNSCLPNDRVLAIRWNPSTQSVFVGFNGGLIEYIPENTSDYSRITVTPKRITPEYKNDIIIDNVPLNATLFIKNAKGETVKTLQADTSTVYWDGTTDTGKRAETGRYSLSVKLSGDDTTHDNVFSFMVIK